MGRTILRLFVQTLLVLAEPVPSFVIDISTQVNHCTHLQNQQEENVGVVNSADKLLGAKTKCRQQFHLTLNIHTNENVEVSSKSQFILITKIYDDALKVDVKLLDPILLKVQTDEITIAYPLSKIYYANNNPHEMIVRKNNDHSSLVCKSTSSVRDTCGYNSQDKSTSQGFCCPCDANSTLVGERCVTHHSKAALFSSIHCLTFHPLWYSVNKLYAPRLDQTVRVSVYQLHKLHHRPATLLGRVIVGTNQKTDISNNHTVEAKYTGPLVDKRIFPDLDIVQNRLFIPAVITYLANTGRNFPAQAKGGAAEFLLVDNDRINMAGTECNKIGASLSAFHASSNMCRQQSQPCFDNQPLHLWLHDKKSESEGEAGRYFVNNFGTLANRPLVKNRQTKQLLLRFAPDQPVSSEVQLMLDASHVTLLHKGLSGQILEVTMTSDSTNTGLIVRVTNTGLVSSSFRISVNRCSQNVLLKTPSRTVVISPLWSAHFGLRLVSQGDKKRLTCTVILQNADKKIVSTRIVDFRMNDHCFCLGTCQCICASEKKLKCVTGSKNIQVPDTRQTREGAAMSSSNSYSKTGQILLYITLSVLLILGIVKALLGIFVSQSVGSAGISLFYDSPLQNYYEPDLLGQSVQCDGSSMPIHPQTGGDVQRMSRVQQLLLNVFFFFYIPLILMHHITHVTGKSKRKHHRKRKQVKGPERQVGYTSL